MHIDLTAAQAIDALKRFEDARAQYVKGTPRFNACQRSIDVLKAHLSTLAVK
jgi:hypothetical protein